MKYYAFLRELDNKLGEFLCSFCSLCYRKKTPGPVPARPKVLIVKFWGMGSILLSSPAIALIKEHYQPSELIILTLEQNRDFCQSLGIFTKVLSCRLSPLPVFVMQLLKNVLYLRRLKIDLLFDFEFFTHFSALTTFFIKAKMNIGFYARENRRGNFYHVHVPFNSYWHITDTYLNFVKKVIPDAGSSSFIVPEHDPDILNKLRLNEKRYIVVNPNSEPIALERRWPKENFIALIWSIQSASKAPVVLIGSKREAPYNEEIARQSLRPEGIINLGGKTNIRELTSVIGSAAFFISNDSGPLHLACALSVPTVSFFGFETPVIYGPKGSEHIKFFKNIDCSPCMNVHHAKTVNCVRGKAECLLHITPEEVWTAIEPMVKIIS